jgi:hypothetical protein
MPNVQQMVAEVCQGVRLHSTISATEVANHVGGEQMAPTQDAWNPIQRVALGSQYKRTYGDCPSSLSRHQIRRGAARQHGRQVLVVEGQNERRVPWVEQRHAEPKDNVFLFLARLTETPRPIARMQDLLYIFLLL